MASFTEIPNPVKANDIFYFVPNLIGFGRVVTLILSFFTMKNHPIITMGCLYSASCLLDAFDGYYARKFSQSTQFGAVLDMVTDRCSTCSLIVFLAVLYPDYFIAWQALISLDLASHYVHMYAQIVSGSTSHKKMREGANWLLKLYYENRTFLFLVCAFNEIFYITLYLQYFDIFYLPNSDINIAYWITVVATPVWFFKQVCNVIQLINAGQMLAELDAKNINASRKEK
jgi:CDP-diacylglycerol--inositol 3-phosphatidyltransferase